MAPPTPRFIKSRATIYTNKTNLDKLGEEKLFEILLVIFVNIL
jgi:hypothetical protein